MKHLIMAALVGACLLAGCSQAQPSSSHMTQEIASEGLLSSSQPAAPDQLQEAQASPEEGQTQTQDVQQLLEALYRCEAEQDAIEIELENLQADFRVGQLAEGDFTAQRATLVDAERQLESQEAQLEAQIYPLLTRPALPTGTLQELLAQLQDNDWAQELLEREEDALELQYRTGEITREDFITQQAALLQQEEELEEEEDRLEVALEAMGWDD